MPFSRAEIAAAKVGKHDIQFQPGATTFVCTVNKVCGEFVWVKVVALPAYDDVKLNRAASRKLIAGVYRAG